MDTLNNTLNTEYVLDGSPTISSSEVTLDIYLPNDDYLTVLLDTEYDSYHDCVDYNIVETYLTDSSGGDVEISSHNIDKIVEDVWCQNKLSDKCYMEMVDNYHSGR